MELNNNNAIDVLEDMEHRDIVAAYVDLYPPRIPRVYRDRSNPMEEYNDEEFRVRFRMTKAATTGNQPSLISCF